MTDRLLAGVAGADSLIGDLLGGGVERGASVHEPPSGVQRPGGTSLTNPIS